MKYAVLNNNAVTQIVDVDEVEVQELAKINQLVILVEGQIPAPQVGWVLQGNQLVPTEVVSPEQIIFEKIADAIKVGKKIKDEASAKIGTRNILLDKTEQEIAVLVSQLIAVGFLLEGGALKTARSSIQAMLPSYPEHTAEMQHVIDQITAYLGD